MKISKLSFKNVYGIKEIVLSPGDITLIEGSNEVGKTSILDAIKTIFTNQGARTRIIHNGETEAELLVELSEGTTIDRKIRSEKSDYIKVSHGKDTIGRPEGFLKSLFSQTQFNPIEDFIEKSPREQKKILLSLCNIDFSEEDYIKNFGEIPQDYDPDRHVLENLEAIQAKSGYYYITRETTNRNRRAKENVRDDIAEQIPDGYVANEWRNVVLLDLFDKVTNAQARNEKIRNSEDYIKSADDKKTAIKDKYALKIKDEKDYTAYRIQKAKADKAKEVTEVREIIQRRKEKIEEYKRLIASEENAINVLESDIKNIENTALPLITSKIVSEGELKIEALSNELKAEMDTISQSIKTAEAFVSNNSKIDIYPLREAAQKAETMKSYIRQADQIESINGEILDLKNISDEFTRKIELARTLPGQLLTRAEMPVPGISIENGELLIDNLPLDNLSDGRKMEIALEVAKSRAGELKTILIDGFEKLSKKRRESFIEKAKKTGLQFLITRVTDSEELTIYEV